MLYLETENLFLLVKNNENVLNPRVLQKKEKEKKEKRMLLLPKLSTEIKVIYFELLRLVGGMRILKEIGSIWQERKRSSAGFLNQLLVYIMTELSC